MKVVNDREVCAAFEKILWASVGQEPDVRELLGSLLEQINKQTLKPDLSDLQAFAEVKDAAKGLKCLLVLDDVVSAETVDTARPRKQMLRKPCMRLTHPMHAPSGRLSSSEL